jgi:hypothetical protein
MSPELSYLLYIVILLALYCTLYCSALDICIVLGQATVKFRIRSWAWRVWGTVLLHEDSCNASDLYRPHVTWKLLLCDLVQTSRYNLVVKLRHLDACPFVHFLRIDPSRICVSHPPWWLCKFWAFVVPLLKCLFSFHIMARWCYLN